MNKREETTTNEFIKKEDSSMYGNASHLGYTVQKICMGINVIKSNSIQVSDELKNFY